jgi:hypothetical protein
MVFPFLFWRFLAGHFIGDFILQTDSVFSIKIKYKWGVILHATIAGIVIFIFGIPYLSHYPMLWLYLFLNIIFHVLVDKAKLIITPKLKKIGFILFLLDQIVHIGTCWVIAILVPDFVHYGETLPLYGNSVLMIFISVYIGVTYGILYFILSIRTSFNLSVSFPKWGMKVVEFIERAAIATFTVLGSFYYLLIPLALFPRGFLLFSKKGKYKVHALDLILSLVFALIAGFILKLTLSIWSIQ